MAGADWGSFAYRNGEPSEENTLGMGRVQLDWNKNYPYLVIDGERVAEQEFCAKHARSYTEVDGDGYIWVDTNLTRYEGEVDGYRFRAQHFAATMLDLELIEPDGTIWTARAGYDYGEWHDGDRTRHYGRIPWV